ncbi:MAG: hypothetical protein AAFN78_02915 [Pseudomonadota bacterium]
MHDFTDPSYRGVAFSNILVVAQGERLQDRAQFERTVVNSVRAQGGNGGAFFQNVDRGAPINRDSVRQALKNGNFDAVLVTRVLDADASMEVGKDIAGARATRRNDRPIDFFRYDYEETPVSGEVSLNVMATLETTLYRVSDETPVWTAVYSNSDTDSAADFIYVSARDIVGLMARDRLIAKP